MIRLTVPPPLPNSGFGQLSNLKQLSVYGCRQLESIPKSTTLPTPHTHMKVCIVYLRINCYPTVVRRKPADQPGEAHPDQREAFGRIPRHSASPPIDTIFKVGYYDAEPNMCRRDCLDARCGRRRCDNNEDAVGWGCGRKQNHQGVSSLPPQTLSLILNHDMYK